MWNEIIERQTCKYISRENKHLYDETDFHILNSQNSKHLNFKVLTLEKHYDAQFSFYLCIIY